MKELKGKSCTKCREFKVFEEFSKLSSRKDGHNFYCKSCSSLMTKERADDRRIGSKRISKERVGEKEYIIPNEVWKDVIDYEGVYQVSDHGRVKSLDRYANGRNGSKVFKKGYLITGITCSRGYHRLEFYKKGKSKTVMVHVLVATHFLKEDEDRKLVNHLDHNKLNNHASNLEWVNNRENVVYSYSHSETYSKYTGVSYFQQCKRWFSSIRVENKIFYLGSFKTELEAYEARCKFEKENNIVNKYL